MVKAYLRYEPATSFGVIASLDSNIAYDRSGKYLFAPALEKVGVWHVRQGTCIKTLVPSSTSHSGPSLAVTSIACSPSHLVASGYGDGSIRIWDSDRGTCETTLNGHKGAVTALRYNNAGSLLASGSKDNDIILWDVVGETGLFRLCGHVGQVTDLVFLFYGKKIISSSKDKFLRVWDIDTQHCVQIIGGHHSEIWSIDVDPDERYIVTGSADPELRFYSVKHELFDGEAMPAEEGIELGQRKWQFLNLFGEIHRKNKDRVATVRFNESGKLLACQVAGKIVDLFHVLDEAEAKKKAKRRVHRKREKKSSKGNAEAAEITAENADGNILSVVVSDVFKLIQTVRASRKICSISFSPIALKDSLATLALSLNNNILEFYSITSSSSTRSAAIELPGHRSVIRSVTLSSDNTLLMSTSDSLVKIWRPASGWCIGTIDSGCGLCGFFLPHNKFAIVGTKDGKIEVLDIGSGTCIEKVDAHHGSIWSIVAIPNENGFVTASADHDVKFWQYQIQMNMSQGSKQLLVSNIRTIKMNEDVLVAAISSDGKYIAVALLDFTVKVFFMDSLKHFLSLYGHKLPVLCMDISSDGDLIVTGSADKNLNIWGLDFGDCHRSLFAHADSVTAVRFVHKTHYVFSAGKDCLVKYWDADKFELLLTLEGHHADVSCLTVSHRGDFVITGSHDRSIRRWDRTEEQLFIEEEKERRLEQMFEPNFDNENMYAAKEEFPEEGVVSLAGKKTQETLTVTDLVINALDLADVELKRMVEHEKEMEEGMVTKFEPNILMLGLSPSDYVLHVISNVQSSDLEQVLLALPFSDALLLLSYLKDWTAYRDKVEIVCRVATMLLQMHHDQLVATSSARAILTALKDLLHARVKESKDTVGFNMAAMDHLKQLMASRSDALFRDVKTKLQEIRSQQQSKLLQNTPEPKRRNKKQKRI